MHTLTKAVYLDRDVLVFDSHNVEITTEMQANRQLQ